MSLHCKLVPVHYREYEYGVLARYHYSSFVSYSIRKVTLRLITNLIDRSLSQNIFK